MKKLLAILLAATLCVAMLAGCNDDSEGETYEFDYLSTDMSQYITLGQYKGLEIDMTPECSEDDIDEYITELIYANETVIEITDRAAENGDTVNIDFKGFMDGEQFSGGTAEDFPLELGSHSFIDGFEAGLVGVMPGETVTLELSFPDPYPNNPDLAGDPVTFEVTVNFIEDYEYPEYNDEFVNDISKGEYTNTVDYSNYIKDTLNADLATEREAYKQSILFEMACENTEVKEYPVSEYDALYNEFVEHYTSTAATYGYSLIEFMNLAYGVSEEEFYATAKTYAYDTVVSNMVIAAIAQTEGITLAEGDYEERLSSIYSEYNYESAEDFEKQYGRDYLEFYFVQEKVMAFIEENCVVVD